MINSIKSVPICTSIHYSLLFWDIKWKIELIFFSLHSVSIFVWDLSCLHRHTTSSNSSRSSIRGSNGNVNLMFVNIRAISSFISTQISPSFFIIFLLCCFSGYTEKLSSNGFMWYYYYLLVVPLLKITKQISLSDYNFVCVYKGMTWMKISMTRADQLHDYSNKQFFKINVICFKSHVH
jgi:hypothetical protein